MKQLITVLILFLLAATLCIVWYDWKLFIILLVFGTAMNIENARK